MLTFPKDTAHVSWTRHIKNKMMFYHLSGAQILRIFRKPDRREEGIAPGTSAAMVRKKRNQKKSSLPPTTYKLQPPHEELWIMYKHAQRGTRNVERKESESSGSNVTRYKLHAARITMISAWRYPGVTKPGERPEIPADAFEGLAEIE